MNNIRQTSTNECNCHMDHGSQGRQNLIDCKHPEAMLENKSMTTKFIRVQGYQGCFPPPTRR